MKRNNNPSTPNVNPPETQKERGSILKHLLLALALLAVSGSLLYAMIVTKPSALVAQPNVAGASDTLTADPNPCATGDPVTVKLTGSADDTNVTISANTIDIGAANTSGNDWAGSFTAGDFGGDIALVAKNNGKVVATNSLLVVKLTGITIDTTPGLVDKFRATVYPNTQPATNFAGGDMTWDGDVVAGNNNGMAAAIPNSQPVGPITAIATLGDITIENDYAVDFTGTIPTNLIAGGKRFDHGRFQSVGKIC